MRSVFSGRGADGRWRGLHCAQARAISGEERLIMHEGKVVAKWLRYDTQLLVFLLRNRRRGRYAGGVPPLRELRRAAVPEWGSEEARRIATEEEAEADAVLASLNAKLDTMRERWLAAQAEGEED